MKSCRIRMRGEVDNFLESEGFYRKHIPKEANSLYIAVSDALFQNQKVALDLQKSIGYTSLDDEKDPFKEVEAVSSKLGIQIQIFDSRTFTNLPPFGINSMSEADPLYLSFSPPGHFDPIYPSSKIQSRGFVQSILYELLYESVFKIPMAREAAWAMLHGEFVNKPVVYDKSFSGTALEALEQSLIPFPYKVAKAMDPCNYRNIDYDVWHITKIGDASSVVCCSCETNKKMGQGVRSIEKKEPSPRNSHTLTPSTERNEDISLVNDDDEWIGKFDFTVPPPPLTDTSQFIVKSVYPILGDCPVLSPPSRIFDNRTLPSGEAVMTSENGVVFRSNKPPPLVIPNSINSHYSPHYLPPPIILSPSPVPNLSPCSPGCCPYFIWPGFY